MTNIKTGECRELSYKYNTDNNSVEFTKGKMHYPGHSFFSNVHKRIQHATSIKFDSKVNVNSITDMYGIFSRNPYLKKLDIDFDTSKVTDMSDMFAFDDNLEYLNLGNHFNTSNVVNMQNMFNGVRSLKSLNLGNQFDTSKVTNMMGMFANDGALQILDLGKKFNTDNLDPEFGFIGMFAGTSDSLKIQNDNILTRVCYKTDVTSNKKISMQNREIPSDCKESVDAGAVFNHLMKKYRNK